MGLDVNEIKSNFPQLAKKANGQPLVYLDSAATALKPIQVIRRLSDYYSGEVSNVHRGAHFFSHHGTLAYESARTTVRKFLSAQEDKEIIFTRGTTESINLVAQVFGESEIKQGDEILLSEMEHHSNIVPWQIIAQKMDAKLKFIPITDNGELDFDKFQGLLNDKTKLLSLSHCSNTLGILNPIQKYIQAAKQNGTRVLIDAAQSVGLVDLDVENLGCDFLTFSGHKLFGPTGIGVLYIHRSLCDILPIYQSGGSMIHEVKLDKSDFLPSPQRFEAGTPHVAGAIGLEAAICFFQQFKKSDILHHEQGLLNQLKDGLRSFESVRFIGESDSQFNILSFQLEGAHHSDIGQILDQQGVAVRVGHHCTQPLMSRFKISGTVRVSLSIYNDSDDVIRFLDALKKAKEMLL